MRSGDFNVFLSVAGGSRRTDILICVTPSANDWGIAHAPRNFPGQAAGCSAAGKFVPLIQRRAVNGSRRRENHAPYRLHAQFGSNTDVFRDLFHASNTFVPFVCMSGAGISLSPIWIIQAGTPPV